MTEIEIECDCGRRGVLLLEGEAGYVRHPEGTPNCSLPPRDIAHPEPPRGRPFPRPAEPVEFGGWVAV